MKIKYAESGFILLISILFIALFRNDPFFWDTVQLGSKHAHWYFDHSFKYLFLPEELDSGHIPFFGFYLGTLWSIFGKSLWVSHFAMLPFIFLIIKYSLSITRILGVEKRAALPALLILSDPTLVAQASLISPDILLIAFFLMGISFILENRKWPLLFVFIGLVLVSNRGVVSIITLNIIYVIYNHLKRSYKLPHLLLQCTLLVVPAVLVFSLYHIAHYHFSGWTFYHNESPWSPSFEKVNLQTSIYNFGLMVWRYIDFGRITLIIVCTTLVICNIEKIKSSPPLPALLSGFVVFVILSSIITLPYAHLTGHRYYLPGFLLIAMLCASLLFSQKNISTKTKGAIYAAIILSNCLGHFLVYPDKIAQGWDASLSYRTHLHQKELIMEYIHTNDIQIEQVGSSFPNLSLDKFYNLSESHQSFALKDFRGTQEYIYYTNVCNDFSDQELEKLKNDYTPIFKIESNTVHSTLLKKVASTSSGDNQE